MDKIWKTNLKQMREAAGLTQVELAKKLKCQQPRIALYEGGFRKPCDLHRIAKINRLLGKVTWERV